MKTEAQRKYDNEYKKNNTVRVTFRLYKNVDQDLIEYIRSMDNVQGTIKEMLREKMKEQKK